MQSCLRNNGCGIFYLTIEDLYNKLNNKELMNRLSDNVMNERMKFSFDSHVPELITFFKKVIKYKKNISNV